MERKRKEFIRTSIHSGRRSIQNRKGYLPSSSHVRIIKTGIFLKLFTVRLAYLYTYNYQVTNRKNCVSDGATSGEAVRIR